MPLHLIIHGEANLNACILQIGFLVRNMNIHPIVFGKAIKLNWNISYCRGVLIRWCFRFLRKEKYDLKFLIACTLVILSIVMCTYFLFRRMTCTIEILSQELYNWWALSIFLLWIDHIYHCQLGNLMTSIMNHSIIMIWK